MRPRVVMTSVTMLVTKVLTLGVVALCRRCPWTGKRFYYLFIRLRFLLPVDTVRLLTLSWYSSNAKNEAGSGDDDGSSNPGTNLFVTGIHPRITEEQVTRLFEKYGEVEKCQIMKDPHSGESRGFGFVNMVLPDQADAAKEGLQGEVIEGRTLSIEKARRARPRTPTPGKYFGPPKRGTYPYA